jgi:hypothetical protein
MRGWFGYKIWATVARQPGTLNLREMFKCGLWDVTAVQRCRLDMTTLRDKERESSEKVVVIG